MARFAVDAVEEEEEKPAESGTPPEEEEPQGKYGIGVLAGLEWSPVPNAKLTSKQENLIKDLVKKASKRDYPARLVEIITTWEAGLFYRGFQFLIPQRGGGWIIPGEYTGYGPSMQLDLALLPTNIYSARAQMIIAALTRTVPTARFAPGTASSDAQITAAESANKYQKVIARNNDLIAIQTDGARFLWTDGRYLYWSRYVLDGQRFGWEEDDQPDDIVPEELPALPEDASGMSRIEAGAASKTHESGETQMEGADAGNLATIEEPPPVAEEESEEAESEEQEADEVPITKRKPRGQELRTCHGKCEVKLTPMSANDLSEVDVLQYETEVDISRAKGMCPWKAGAIRAATTDSNSSEIAKLARQNLKLGMMSTYVTSDSVAEDVTVTRSWLRPSYLMNIEDEAERDKLIEMFPNGCYVMTMGETFCFARNESMDASWALAQAYSGDGQNRNAMGTSTLPIQKRLNNWLDLLNDYFVRTVPKKWLDSRAFSVEAIRQQTNVPGDIGAFKRQAGVPVNELIFIEPSPQPQTSLPEFIKEYSGPLAELLSGAYPALAGGDVGTADSGVAIATQRDSALGRLAPTWHSMKNAEATSMKQLVQWGAKCRKGTVTEKIPGGETIKLEINDLKGNILVFAESDENFPETYTQRKNVIMQLFGDAAKNPQLMEVFFNAANLEFLQGTIGLSDFYIPQVASRNKQLGEIEVLLKSVPVPNPKVVTLKEKIAQMKEAGVPPEEFAAAEQEIAALPPEVSSIEVDAEHEDNSTEADTCWQFMNGNEGRIAKRMNKDGFRNVTLHYDAHAAAVAAKQNALPAGKPPSESISFKDVAQVDMGAARQMLTKGGIQPSPAAGTPAPVPPAASPSKAPAAPIAVGTPEGTGGNPKL